jgi:hypothetical protein
VSPNAKPRIGQRRSLSFADSVDFADVVIEITRGEIAARISLALLGYRRSRDLSQHCSH